nr:zinc finger, CCHC-type [Tanacetum cinerariifolium]
MEIVGSVESMVEWREEKGEESGIVGGKKDESLYDAWTRFKDLLLKVPHHGLDLWLQVPIFYDHVNYATQMAVDYATGERLRKLREELAWETI